MIASVILLLQQQINKHTTRYLSLGWGVIANYRLLFRQNIAILYRQYRQ